MAGEMVPFTVFATDCKYSDEGGGDENKDINKKLCKRTFPLAKLFIDKPELSKIVKSNECEQVEVHSIHPTTSLKGASCFTSL